MRFRGFSLLEVMISSAMVGLLGAGALSLVSHVSRETAEERNRALATADAIATVERITQLVSVSASHGGGARLCELLDAAGGPFSGGDPPAGVCPERSVTNVPVPGSSLRRAVTLTEVDVDGASAFRIVVTVTGAAMSQPVVFTTIVPIAGVA